jgi:hypothetical protein
MKGLKRVFALAVVFAMILSCVPAMAATRFVDVSDDDAVVVDVLTSLGIIQGYDENGTWYFKGENTITRAEFAAVVTRLLGMEDSAKTQRETGFTDVPASHWASGYIKTAVDTNGIIVGMGDGTFAPESPVTYEQAVKMLVCALGYETKALEEGTYPTGYIFVAKTMGLLDDVAGAVGQEAPRSMVAQLLYNALDVPLMQKILSGTTKSYYGVYDGQEYTPKKTVMSEYLNIVKLVGTVTKNEISAGGREGIVTINIADNFGTRFADTNAIYKEGASTDFAVGETNAKDFIGYEVLAFVTYTSSRTTDPVILAIQDNSKLGSKFTLDLDDIKSVEAKETVTTITYYTDEAQSKTSKLYVASAAKDLTAYFNGLLEANYTGADFEDQFNADKFKDVNGTLELRSTTTSGVYDYNVMSFEIFKTFVVGESVGDPSYKVYPSDDFDYDGLAYIPFDPTDKDITTTIVDKNGKAVDPESLKEWDVLSVKVDNPLVGVTKDKKVFDCILVQESINGTVTEKDDSSTPKKVIIDGEEYEYASDSLADNIKLGDAGEFYLDATGKVAAYDKTISKSGNYAIVLNADKSTASLDEVWKVKMYTTDGKVAIYNLAEKVRVRDGINSYKSVDDKVVGAELKEAEKPLVITYTTNSDGEINKICTAANDLAAGSAIAYNQEYNKADLYINANKVANASIVGEKRDYPTLKVGKTFTMNEETKVVALDASDLSKVTAEDFDLYAGTDLKTDVDNLTKVSVYNVNSNNVPGFVFIEGSIDSAYDTTGLALVKSVNQTTNAEGTDVAKINAITTAAEGVESFVKDENAKFDEVKVGEVFIPGTKNSNDELKTAEVLVKATGSFFAPNTESGSYLEKWAGKSNTDVEFYFGKVTDKVSNTIYFTNELDKSGVEKEETIQIPASKTALVYDARKNASNKVFVSTASEIEKFVDYRDADGNFVYDGDERVRVPSSYTDEEPVVFYIFVREYNGSIEDVVIYIYNTATPDSRIKVTSVATTVSALDAIVEDEEDIIVED